MSQLYRFIQIDSTFGGRLQCSGGRRGAGAAAWMAESAAAAAASRASRRLNTVAANIDN